MSILGSSKTNVSIVADSPMVELYVIELSLVFDLFISSSGLSKRFWRGMALKLADRLNKLTGAPKEVKSEASKKGPTAPEPEAPKEKILSRDEEFQQRFSLPSTEVILKDYTATMEQMMSQYGNLYISENYISFYSKIFGYESKTVISIRSVRGFNKKGNDKLVIKYAKKKITLRFDDGIDEVIKILSGLQKNKDDSQRELNNSQADFKKLEVSKVQAL